MNLDTQDAWELVDRKAWDPDWEQVMVFLAGKLAASPKAERDFLGLLSDETKDDVFRHRAGVAALCLDEIPPNARPPLRHQIDRITEAVFSLWWEHKPPYLLSREPPIDSHGSILTPTAIRKPLVAHLTRGLPALARTNGRYLGVALLDWLAERLGHAELFIHETHTGDGNVANTLALREGKWVIAFQQHGQSEAVVAIIEIGSAAANPVIEERLVELLLGGSVLLAGEALWAIRSAKPRRELVKLLAEMVHYTAPEVLSWVSAAPIPPEWNAEFAEAKSARMREWVAGAIRRIGVSAATPAILNGVAELQQYEDHDATSAFKHHDATSAIGALGRPGAPLAELRQAEHAEYIEAKSDPVRLARIAELLQDEYPWLRCKAAEDVAKIGPAAATPAILKGIEQMLRDEDPDVRKAAALAAAMMGRAAATSEIIEALRSADIGDEEAIASFALGKMGAVPYTGSPSFRGIRTIRGLIGALSATHYEYSKLLDGLYEVGDIRRFLSGDDKVAIEAVADIMAYGERFFEGPDGRWETRSIEDLSAWNPPGADIAWMSS